MRLSGAVWRQVVEQDRENALTIIATNHLSPVHRDEPGSGCVLPSLGAVVLSRAVDDEELSGEILESVLASIIPAD